jgi:Uma2 family endonuclease
MPPEGDEHFIAKTGARASLSGHYARIGRRAYIGCELPVYYPGERVFAPDVMVVLDVPTHRRERWTVSDEGRGLDLALEVLVSGNRRKDLADNVERYARLGIQEYFIFDHTRRKLTAYRLPPGRGPQGSQKRSYTPILPQGGRYASTVLGLDLAVQEGRLRFFHGSSVLLDADEMIHALESMVDTIEARARAAEERAEEETRKRKEETRKRKEEAQLRERAERERDEAKRRLAEALAELDRLKASREP